MNTPTRTETVEDSLKRLSKVRTKVTCRQHVADFANIVKAFIGTNYLGLPYAFMQSGLVLGSITLVIIAALTDHCCHLVVKCKYRLIDDICKRKLGGDELLGREVTEEVLSEVADLRKRLQKNMDYGDVAKLTMGKWGPLLVNICLIITQCGFCIGYFIFIGNTIYQLFPVEQRNISEANLSHVIVNGNPVVHAQNPVIARHLMSLEEDTDITDKITNIMSNVTNSFSTNNTSDDYPYTTETTMSESTTLSTTASSHFPNVSSTMLPSSNHSTPAHGSSLVMISLAPPLELLVLFPLPLFILFTYFRSIRGLGSVSVLANVAIFVGYFLVLAHLISDLKLNPNTEIFAKVTTYPVFFGLVTGAYEGIGTVIPIESSMEGNRHNFSNFLHGGIGLISVVLASFGVLGYMKYGEHTPQIITQALPPNSVVSIIVNATLMFAVIFTYPLQVFPVTEIMEGYIFSEGKCCGPKKQHLHLGVKDSDVSSVEADPLLSDEEETPLPVASSISVSISTWKRNLFRTLIPCVLAGIAVVFRNSFAYVSAFTAAIGSTMLAYVLPCAFHISLIKHEGHKLLIAKNVFIILFGICAGVTSEAVTIMELIRRT